MGLMVARLYVVFGVTSAVARLSVLNSAANDERSVENESLRKSWPTEDQAAAAERARLPVTRLATDGVADCLTPENGSCSGLEPPSTIGGSSVGSGAIRDQR